MDEPFQIGCGECGSKFDTPEQYIDHILATEHAPDELLAQLRDGSGYAALMRELATVQEHGARGKTPPNVRQLTMDEVPDEIREKYEALERAEMERFAATLSTAELIAHLEAIGDMMTRLASVRPASDAGDKIILSIRAAAIRLRERVTAELRIIDAFVALVNTRAENDIANDGPIEGAHYRAMEAVRTEWYTTRPPFPAEKASDDVRRIQTDESNRDDTE